MKENNTSSKIDDLVSIVLPVYNPKEYFTESLNSILDQSYNNFELIIIDNSSDESCQKILKLFDDKRIIYLKSTTKNIVEALNLGLDYAKGKYIVRMDADDVCDRNRIKIQIEIIKNKDIDICGSNSLIIDENNKILDVFLAPKSEEMLIPFLTKFVPFYHGSVAYKKEFILKNNLRYSSRNFSHDKVLWMDFFTHGAKFYNVDQFLYFFRINPNSFYHEYNKKIHLEQNKINKKFVKMNKDKIDSQLNFVIKNYNFYNEKEKEVIVEFYFYCFFNFLEFKYLKILPIAKKRYLILNILKIFSFKFF